MEALVGAEDAAESLLARMTRPFDAPFAPGIALTNALIAIRRGEPGDAGSDIDAVDLNRPSANPGFKTAMYTLAAVAKTIQGSNDALDRCEIALVHSDRQGATLWHAVAASGEGGLDRRLDNEIATIPEGLRVRGLDRR